MKHFFSLADVRAEIDEIDLALVALLKRRMNAIVAAPNFKAGAHEARIDSRVLEVECNVRAAALEVGFDENRAAKIWQFMMDECIAFEEDVMKNREKTA